MKTLNSQILFVVIFVCCIHLIVGQIGFPERSEEEKGKQNANNRTPVFIPSRCKENELLYPGDQADDWICDCFPGHLYYPSTDKCYPAFRQGPCTDGNVLILPRKKVIPECVTNSCNRDGSIPIRGRCYNLGEAGPCPNPELSYVLGVNATTLEVTCVKLSVDIGNRIGEDENENIINQLKLGEVPICARGCKRFINGTCPIEK